MFRGVRVSGAFLFLLLFFSVYKTLRSFCGLRLNALLYFCLMCRDLRSLLLCRRLMCLQELCGLKRDRLLLASKYSSELEEIDCTIG